MDRVADLPTKSSRTAEYRKRVQELLSQYMAERPQSEEIETQFIADTEQDHYQLVNVGWLNKRRIYGCILHIDIKGEKVWIQHNGTERLVAEELADLGIPKEHIVLGFHSPYRRQFTEFGVN
jgi:hypothetical protein